MFVFRPNKILWIFVLLLGACSEVTTEENVSSRRSIQTSSESDATKETKRSKSKTVESSSSTTDNNSNQNLEVTPSQESDKDPEKNTNGLNSNQVDTVPGTNSDLTNNNTNTNTNTSTNTTNTSTETVTPVTPQEVVIDSVEAGRKALQNRSFSAYSYQYRVQKFRIPLIQTDNLLGQVPIANDRVQKFYVSHWEKRDERCAYALQGEHQGKYSDYVLAECVDTNIFGAQNCPNPQLLKFLGTRDFGSFKKAWGVSFSCLGTIGTTMLKYSALAGFEYLSRHEIWFHPDSNHFRKKVAEVYVVSVQSSPTETFESMLKTNTANEAYAIYYENYQPTVSPQKGYSNYGSYELSGSVRTPGTYAGTALCSVNANMAISYISLGALYLSTQTGGNDLYYAFGYWVTGLPQDAFTSGVWANSHSNRNPFRPGEAWSSISFTTTKLPDAPFFYVVANESITMNQGITRHGYGYSTVQNIKPFYCFAHQLNGGMPLQEYDSSL